ncbi:MAG: threonine synthase [Bacteroidia bacterium]|nr:threonine synthase [Bacteroidia bacterium]
MLFDPLNGKTYDGPLWRSPEGNMLQVRNTIHFDPARIDVHQQGQWRYRAFMPLAEDTQPVSLGEGYTPVVPLPFPDKTLYAKLELLYPTGSYKDRGATFLLSKIHELGITEIVEDSSGNAGCAIAAYAALAGIRCHIVVPESTSPAKIRQISAYGANVHTVPGNRTDATEYALRMTRDMYFASHCYNPWFFQGTMTFAFEVWEQQALPEEIIFPTGNGTLLLGAWLGFSKLKEAGIIERIPALSAAQADLCAPLFHAWKEIEFPGGKPTLAEGITVQQPVRKQEILDAVRNSGGTVYTVTEDEIMQAHRALAHNGIYAEYTSGVAYAAVKQSKFSHILMPVTGSGLKNRV